VGHSRFVARRLSTLGIAALVAGAVLVGTGVAVSAQTVPQAAAASNGANKKHPTTTTTTTTVVVPSTTTQPCTPAPTTATGVNTTVTPNTTATLTMTPGTCIVSGTVVSLSGSGFQASSDGTFLECNSDPNQPTVMYLGSAIPVSCTSPLETNQGPGIVSTTAGGDIGPNNFTVLEAASGVGPPCGSSCTGAEATDSSGGSTVADAAKYPCPPTAAQMALSPPDTCGIVFGDEAGDGVTVPISFNLLVAPPATVPPTTTATPTATVAPAAKAATASTTNTASSSLAFTGAGPGLWWLALVGLVLMAMGVAALVLVDEPRRLARLAVSYARRSRNRAP
jgi:hypothetical protein